MKFGILQAENPRSPMYQNQVCCTIGRELQWQKDQSIFNSPTVKHFAIPAGKAGQSCFSKH